MHAESICGAEATESRKIPNPSRASDCWLIRGTATHDVEWPKILDSYGNAEADSQGKPSVNRNSILPDQLGR
jgi:hypothetical protein